MNTKTSLALVSTSALAAGMAQGSVIYSGALNLQQAFNNTEPRQGIDMNGDGTNDVTFGFETNALKPYVDARTFVAADLPAQSGILGIMEMANTGLPVTTAGTMIDASYAATYPPAVAGRGYMYQDANQNPAGAWSNTALTDAYVGVTLAVSGGTSYGWLHFIDDPVSNPQTLTLVDFAYESTPGVGIAAGTVPEPSAGVLGALGVAGLLAARRRR
jgi:PEP-CTERM motif